MHPTDSERTSENTSDRGLLLKPLINMLLTVIPFPPVITEIGISRVPKRLSAACAQPNPSEARFYLLALCAKFL